MGLSLRATIRGQGPRSMLLIETKAKTKSLGPRPRTKIVVGVCVLFVTLTILLLWRYRVRWSTQQTVTDHHPRLDEAALQAETAGVQAGPRHLSETAINNRLATIDGQRILCAEIGERDNGLDDESLVRAESALDVRNHIDQECVGAIIRRLNSDNIYHTAYPLITSQEEARHRVEKHLLLRQPDETLTALRGMFNLGNGDASWEVLPLIQFLDLRIACGDLRHSIDDMTKAKNPDVSGFHDTYKKLCQ